MARVRPEAASSRRGREAGRGYIGLLVALVVVGFGVHAARTYFAISSRANALTDFSYEILKTADRQKKTAEDLRFDIYKKAQELGVPLKDERRIDVVRDDQGWRVRLEWHDTFQVPGFSRELHHVIDHRWKRF